MFMPYASEIHWSRALKDYNCTTLLIKRNDQNDGQEKFGLQNKPSLIVMNQMVIFIVCGRVINKSSLKQVNLYNIIIFIYNYEF